MFISFLFINIKNKPQLGGVMKKYMVLIISLVSLIFIINVIANSYSKDYNLVLDTNIKTAAIGETIPFYLIIKGDMGKILKNNKKYEFVNLEEKEKYANSTDSGFVHSFYIKPKKEGKLEVGPYIVNFQGQKLTSNKVIITVYKQHKRFDKFSK